MSDRFWLSVSLKISYANARLKRLLADAELVKDALREIATGNF